MLSGSYINSRPGKDSAKGNSLCAQGFPLVSTPAVHRRLVTLNMAS